MKHYKVFIASVGLTVLVVAGSVGLARVKVEKEYNLEWYDQIIVITLLSIPVVSL